ncbi:hypothetical protein ACFPOA_12800 [Lysobacter niabensis]|uniref:hypothetical protein n=1 Tax=Agrilutibacter niabensis TaxID=380628 RepID=UPI00361B9244
MAFDAFALVLAMLALGYLLQRLRLLPANAGQVLNLVVLYVCLPAAVLRYAPLLAVAALSRWLPLRDEERAVLLLTVALGNTSFLGYPLWCR